MRKHWLVIIIASLLAMTALASCSNADAKTAEVSCDGNVAKEISNTEAELKDARKDAKDAEGTLAESDANNRVNELEAQLDKLLACEQPAAPTTETTTANCEGGRYSLVLDENEKNRILSKGVQVPSSEEMRQEILAFNSRDVRGLMVYYNASPLGATSPITDIAVLVEGGKVVNGACFSETGMQKYAEWATLWKVAVIQPTDQMPAGWGNTGIDNGVPSSGAPPKGDTSGWIVVFVDASGKVIGEHGVMKRCGNPVTPKPVAPPGKTDENPPTSQPGCPPPVGVPPEFWDYERCVKKDTSFDYQQNQSRARQDPQNNTTSGVNVGPTPGAPPQPHVPAPGPTPSTGTPAPNPTPGGYDSGSSTGSGTPGGSTSNPDGTTDGGGSTPPPPGPPVTVDTGTHSGDPGGF